MAALAAFETLAAGGSPVATRFLAYLYLGGKAVVKNPAKAAELLRGAS